MNNRLEAFSKSEIGKLVRDELVKMTVSGEYVTESSYSSLNSGGMSFAERQMRYMSRYPNMNYTQYISNLKIMTRRSK